MVKTKKKKNTKKKKSKFIGKGSYGCVFKPMIPCKKDLTKKKKVKKNKVSKVFVKKDNSINKEIKMNKLIKKIPNYKDWAYIWNKNCDPPNYEDIIKISEMDICLEKMKKNKKDFDKNSNMLIGEYGGIPFSNKCLQIMKKSNFQNKKSFIQSFKTLFKYLEPLFKGLVELKKYKIIHQDLSHSNVMFKDNKCYMIDFGLSCKISDKNCIKERSLKQMKGSRVYDPYPYDYIFLYADKDQLNEELKYFEDGLLRDNHLDYLVIHKDIFNRQNIEDLIINNLFYESKNKKLVIENLDTYSLGILLPMIIYDTATKHKINKEKFLKCFDYTEIQNHLSLFKDMTEYHGEDRIPIEEAYKRYQSLL